MRWNRAHSDLRADPSEIHVWRVSLDAGPDPDGLAEMLSEAELRRAERFRHAIHRRRWGVAQAALRSILAAYAEVEPRAIAFDHGPGGKPYLAGRGPDLRFNLTHTGDLALVAVALGREVGIDAERMRSDRPIEDLARRWFAPREADAVLDLPAAERAAGFFACWTRKEAVIKAEGLTVPAALKRFHVPVGPLEEDVVEGPERAWSLASLDVGPGYAAALAWEGTGGTTRGYQWHF